MSRISYLVATGMAIAIIAITGTLAPAFAQAMPNPKLTPGATSNLTAKQLCDPKFHTGSVRNVPESEKKAVYAEYGMVPHQGACAPAGCEVDHLISLEIGGSNDIKNLWPQSYTPIGAHQKDVLENRLKTMVCKGQISLKDAQVQIATDWYRAYQKYVLAALKNKSAGNKPRTIHEIGADVR